MSEPKRIEYEGPVSIDFEEGYPVLETGEWLPPNHRGHSRFDGDNLADQLYELVDSKTDGDGWRSPIVLTRVRVVLEVLDSTELEPPKPPPTPEQLEEYPAPPIDFDPPPAPETPCDTTDDTR